MTNAQFLARQVAFDVLKAYHLQIKSVNVVDSSAVERERAQAAAFAAAEKNIRAILLNPEATNDISWVNRKSEQE